MLGSIDDEDSASFGLTEVLLQAPTVSLRLELVNFDQDENISVEMAVQTHHASALHTKSSLLANLREFLPAISRLRSMDQHHDVNSLNSDSNDKSPESLCWRTGVRHVARLAIVNF